MADTTRRTLLTTAAAPAVSGTIPAAAVPLLPAEHPDAALLDAWSRYAAGYRVLFALADADRYDDDDPDRLAAYSVMDAADDVLLTAPWHTPAGLVKKLQRLLIAESDSRAAHRALVMGTPIPDDEVGLIADAYRVVWLMLRHAETLAGMGGTPHA